MKTIFDKFCDAIHKEAEKYKGKLIHDCVFMNRDTKMKLIKYFYEKSPNQIRINGRCVIIMDLIAVDYPQIEDDEFLFRPPSVTEHSRRCGKSEMTKVLNDAVKYLNLMNDIPKQKQIFVHPDIAKKYPEITKFKNVNVSEFIQSKDDKGQDIYFIADPQAMKKQEDDFSKAFEENS
jgi:hypothetical protein